jgi:hypothetical protein
LLVLLLLGEAMWAAAMGAATGDAGEEGGIVVSVIVEEDFLAL